jgi:DNA repair exonuclease SbcCD ATPase subunit
MAVGVLVALAGAVLPAGPVLGADPFREAREAILDVRDLLQDFLRSVNDTQRFARTSQREIESTLRTLQRGQIRLDRIDDLISDLDQAVIDLDSARSEFLNLEDVRRQIEPLGDLAVKVVELANQGIISLAQSNAILRGLDQIATQLGRVDIEMSDVSDRLREASRELDRAIDDLEEIIDNFFFFIDDTTTNPVVDRADLLDPIDSLRRAVNALKAVDRRTLRLRDRLREIDRRLTRINSDLRPKSQRSTPTPSVGLGVIHTVTVFTLAGRSSHPGVSANGVYLLLRKIETTQGTRLVVEKMLYKR